MSWARTKYKSSESSPTRGMWIEMLLPYSGAVPVRVIPHTGDVD